MSYITTFDMVFWVNVLLGAAMALLQLVFVGKIAKAIIAMFKRYDKKPVVAVIAVSVLFTAASLAVLVWSLMTSVEGTMTATFWYVVVAAIFHKAFARHNTRLIMRALSN